MQLHKFTDEEYKDGTKFLSDLKIIEGWEYICYAVRTESYYLRLAEQGVAVKPRSVRNLSEELYLGTLTQISGNVVLIFRMGKDIENVLDAKNIQMWLIRQLHKDLIC